MNGVQVVVMRAEVAQQQLVVPVWGRFLLVAACLGATTATQLVVPAWDRPVFRQNGSECIRAAPFGAENTTNHRTTFWTIPEGEAPVNGWPVYLYFPPWAAPGADENGACDAGAIPPPLLPSCVALLAQICPVTAPNGCEACVQAVMHTHRQAWQAAKCPAPRSVGGGATDWMWCRGHGSYPKDPIFMQPVRPPPHPRCQHFCSRHAEVVAPPASKAPMPHSCTRSDLSLSLSLSLSATNSALLLFQNKKEVEV
jgi:hypothetical protein